ncbi:hypothetical protein HPQ64_18415 [Rhizobiales bacterium]|uniref:hypothetical protein n=1 Tax=Hongsoonwoonella zoysiae TaxID=2821844 RepID=UPI00156022A2|nr:hypothetical protein [Hongsoonwoonella zoysiae]NRG19668.1 hypothetical protein [Hongsoonwoonella zoysiae]
MSDIWVNYRATVSYDGKIETIPVQAMSEHEVADHARIMAGFEFGWNPADVKIVSFEPDPEGRLEHGHIHMFEVSVRPEGGEPQTFRLKARDADCAEGLAVLHCADKAGLDPREVDVLNVVPV